MIPKGKTMSAPVYMVFFVRTLYLDDFVEDPLKQPSAIIFARQEDVLGETYCYLESKMEEKEPNVRTRSFVQVIHLIFRN